VCGERGHKMDKGHAGGGEEFQQVIVEVGGRR